MQEIAILQDGLFEEHSNGQGHPERPERLRAIAEMLGAYRYGEWLRSVTPVDASQKALSRVHEKNYVKSIASTRGCDFHMLDMDTGVGPKSYDAAVRAAGASMRLVDAVIDGEAPTGFAFVRPPGHHAESGRAMGFCLFNNAAVAAAHARARGLSHVLILDWDVHHGNGTQEIFYNNGHVHYFSIHQYPLYPGTGRVAEYGGGNGIGATINVPFPAGMTGSAYGAAFEQLLLPVVKELRPELILVSSGFDAHRDDPLAGMQLSTEAYGTMARFLQCLAHAVGSKVAYILEGGYDPGALTGGVEAVLDVLVHGDELPPSPAWPRPDRIPEPARAVLREVKGIQSRYWRSLQKPRRRTYVRGR